MVSQQLQHVRFGQNNRWPLSGEEIKYLSMWRSEETGTSLTQRVEKRVSFFSDKSLSVGLIWRGQYVGVLRWSAHHTPPFLFVFGMG
jgi:hypothetical protein